MGDPKPIASLSSTLLARKGHAKPAMRPQGFAGFGFGGTTQGLDDLGWNDMGSEHAPAMPQAISADIVPIMPVAPVEPPLVLRQQEELARELAPSLVEKARPEADLETEVDRAPNVARVRSAPGSKGKAAFTLRLDPDRHLRLRLVCAVTHRSAQSIVIGALDAFLSTQPAVSALAMTAARTNDQ